MPPFNIHVIANDPGTTPRREVLLTTTASTINLNSGGLPFLAPFDGMSDDNEIGFVFASQQSGQVDQICWATAVVIGAMYGLDSVTNCDDIMSLNDCGAKSFLNVASTCGGDLFDPPGKCYLGNTTQNSFTVISTTAGPSQSIFVNSFEGFEEPNAGPSLGFLN